MATAVSQITPAFSAFESQLKTLCLKEFPCGSGTWRESKPTKLQKLKNAEKVESRFSITLKDFGAQHEKTETLEEYVGSSRSPWHLDYSWSNEAKQLREISVKSPWLIDDKFVLNHFKTLRIVNKDVTEVDANLLKFENLEELTLSCNFLSRVDSKHLPPNLKVLEVCANEISDLSSLCTRPPCLIHLGMGFNKISLIGDYLTGVYWPCLLSLDLSNNNLSDLLDIVRKLSSLPKLRNLVLQGNPLSLIPGYRGYTVDSLKKLSILDDIMISADERHYFKGLARRREHILDEAKIHLAVTYIKGVPMPEEMKNAEEQPEYPVIERKYFVQFKFLEDVSPRHETLMMNEDDLEGELPVFTVFQTEGSDRDSAEPMMMSADDPMVEKNVAFTQDPQILHTIHTEMTTSEQSPVPEERSEGSKEEGDEEAEKRVKVAPINSESHVWADEIECNWTKAVLRDDLVALRDFFKQGMEVSVIEEMVIGFPVEEATSPSGKTGGKDKKDKKEKVRAASGGKDKGGDKKKKKEPEVELKRNPPTFTTLATWHVPLAEFLEGEFEFKSVFSQDGIQVASLSQGRDTDSARKDGRKGDTKDKDKNKKPGSASAKKKEDKSKERKPSAAKSGKGDKGDKGTAKGGKGAPGAVEEEEEETGPPPPLEIEISVKLHHWKTALDLLKDEEEKKKQEEEEEAARNNINNNNTETTE